VPIIVSPLPPPDVVFIEGRALSTTSLATFAALRASAMRFSITSPEALAWLGLLACLGGAALEVVLLTSVGAAREKELLASDRAMVVDLAFEMTDLMSFSLSSENVGR
jgi:hypothetical protein